MEKIRSMVVIICVGFASAAGLLAQETHEVGAPKWINNDKITDGIAAVGNNAGANKGYALAMSDACTKLAEKLDVRLHNMFDNLNEQIIMSTPNGSAKPINSDIMNRLIGDATRQVKYDKLYGLKINGKWKSSATQYVFMKISKEALDKIMKETANKVIQEEVAIGEKYWASALDKVDAAVDAANAKEDKDKAAPNANT